MTDFDIKNVAKVAPKLRIQDYIVLFYARPKFGKSTFGACYGNPLFLGFEPGTNALEVAAVPIQDWKWFITNIVNQAEKVVKEGEKLPYDAIVVDTADVAYRMCQQYILKREGIQHESELQWGKGYAFVREEFEGAILRLTKLGLGVLFISHDDTKEFTTKSGEKYNKIVPTLTGRARDVIVNLADIIIYGDSDIVRDPETKEVHEIRTLFTRDSMEHEAGGRLKYLPDKISFGETAEEGYTNFIVAFAEALRKQFPQHFDKKGNPTVAASTPAILKEQEEKTEVKTELNAEPPVEEEKPRRKAKAKKEETSSPSEDKSNAPTAEALADVRREVGDAATSIFKRKLKTAQEIVDLITKHNPGISSASKIESINGGMKTLVEMKRILNGEE